MLAMAVACVMLIGVIVHAQDAHAPDSQATAPAAKAATSDVKLPAAAPKNADGALAKAKEALEFGKARNWFGMSGAIIWLIMFGLKAGKVFKRFGKRWAYVIVPVLGVAAMLLSKFAGDLSWNAAVAVLTSAPTVALLNDFVKRGVLGKEPKTPINGGA